MLTVLLLLLILIVWIVVGFIRFMRLSIMFGAGTTPFDKILIAPAIAILMVLDFFRSNK